MWSIISSLDIISEDTDMHDYDEKKDVLNRIFSKQREEDPTPSKSIKELIKEEKFESESSMQETPAKKTLDERLGPESMFLEHFDIKKEANMDFREKSASDYQESRFEEDFFEEDEMPGTSSASKNKKPGKSFNQQVEQLVLQFISDFIDEHGSFW